MSTMLPCCVARDTVVSGVAGLYALTITGLGVVFPLAFFLSGEHLQRGLYLSVSRELSTNSARL